MKIIAAIILFICVVFFLYFGYVYFSKYSRYFWEQLICVLLIGFLCASSTWYILNLLGV